MNFLAHIYLSGNNTCVTIGNFIADSIKGREYKEYPKEIQIGILLHRAIDSYTDTHPIVRKSAKRLRKKYGHYAGVIVDILYDHFLAKNWTNYSNTPLEEYVENFYSTLEDNYVILPERIKQLMPYMITDNWLVSYASVSGITKVLEGMNRRTKHKSGMNKAVEELQEFYKEFEIEFATFFDELIEYSQVKLKELQVKYNK